MPSPDPPILEPHPRVGVVFNMDGFARPNKRGCAEHCGEIGWEDFEEGDYKLHVTKGVQLVKIQKGVKRNGDAGIGRHFQAHPGEIYRLTAVVRLKRKHGDGVKFRVNISPRELWGPQTGEEGNRSLADVTDKPVTVTCVQEMHPGTEQVTVRVKLHTDPGEAGDGEIHSWKLERLR